MTFIHLGPDGPGAGVKEKVQNKSEGVGVPTQQFVEET